MSLESLLFEAGVILLLIVLNGFFSTSEIAILSSKRSLLDKLAEEGNKSAKLVTEMKNQPERFLATIQVGITVIGTLASVIGGVTAIEFLKPVYEKIPLPVVQNSAEFLAITTIVVLISFFMLIIGELAPKSLALTHPEKIACSTVKAVNTLSRLTSIIVTILAASTKLVLKIFGIESTNKEVFISEDEIRYFIKEGRDKGIIEETEAALLHGVFEFADTTVEDIMVPKPKLVAIDINIQPKDILTFISEAGFSRYPVYSESLDNIEGILFNKDLLKVLDSGERIDLREIMRAPYFVPSSIMISKLLREMQRRKSHIAIVIDEHGDVDGIITIEDILEEIVGEIEDEYDEAKDDKIEKLKDGSYIIEAATSIRDLEELELGFSDEDIEEFNTLGGFMLARLQRIPKGGEFVLTGTHRFTVVDVEKNRIAKIKVDKVEGKVVSN